MRKPLLAALTAALFVGACGGGPGASRHKMPETLAPKGGYAPKAVDRRALVDQVVALTVERMPGGAIIRATGLPPSQGWWDAELVAENGGEPENGVLTYKFRVAPPPRPTQVSTPPSREITVAAYVTDITLAKLHQITVVGERNSRSLRH